MESLPQFVSDNRFWIFPPLILGGLYVIVWTVIQLIKEEIHTYHHHPDLAFHFRDFFPAWIRWQTVIDTATVIWLALLVVSLFYNVECINVLLFVIGLLFAAEIVIAYKHRESFSQFIRHKWLDIIMLLPMLRVFKLGKLTRLAKLTRIKTLAAVQRIADWLKERLENIAIIA